MKKANSNTVFYKTDAGTLTITLENNQIVTAQFVNDSSRNTLNKIDHEFKIEGTPFQKLVWQATMQIPAGKTVSYQQLAAKIGHPKAFRAVANALGKNKIAYFIPCHRVIRKNGELGGYYWGIDVKKKLLQAEGAL